MRACNLVRGGRGRGEKKETISAKNGSPHNGTYIPHDVVFFFARNTWRHFYRLALPTCQSILNVTSILATYTVGITVF